jgi:hypothetical protein
MPACPLALLGARMRTLLAAFADQGDEDSLTGNAKFARRAYEVLTDERRDIKGWIDYVLIYVDRNQVDDTQKEKINKKFDRFVNTLQELISTARKAYIKLEASERAREAYTKLNDSEKKAEDAHYVQRRESIESAEQFCFEQRARLQRILAGQEKIVRVERDPTMSSVPPWTEFDDYDPDEDEQQDIPLDYDGKPPEHTAPSAPQSKKLIRPVKPPSGSDEDESDTHTPPPGGAPKAKHATPPPQAQAPEKPAAPEKTAALEEPAPEEPAPGEPVPEEPAPEEPAPADAPEDEFYDDDFEDTAIVQLITPLFVHQQKLIDEFKSFKHKKAPPVVHSLKTAESPVDAARDTFAVCAKEFVRVMSTMQDAFNEEHADVKAEMHRTYIEAIEHTNTGACFRDLYNDEKHTMAPFDSEHHHILSAQAIFAPFNLAAPAAVAPEKERIEVDPARAAGTKKKVEVEEDPNELRTRAAGKKTSEVIVDPEHQKKARAALKRKDELDKMRAADTEKKIELRLRAEALTKAHVKAQVRALIHAACPPTPAPAWPKRVLLSSRSLSHVLCARASSIAILAETHPSLAALRAAIELPPVRRALSIV